MKVRIKQVTAVIDYEGVKRKEELGSNFSVGETFLVYGMIFRGGQCYFNTFDNRHIVLLNKAFVEITEDQIPAIWKGKIWDEDDSFTLWPELFYDEGFAENFSDYEEKERQQFEVLRKEIEYNG